MNENSKGSGYDLQGRVAMVTGAATGIGEASARALAAAGAKVIVTDVAETGAVASDIQGLSKRLDVSNEDDWIDAMAFAKAEAGGLDILVNNAGIWRFKPLVEVTVEEWRKVYKINVEGVFLGCKHAIPLLAEGAGTWEGGSAIVNISSVGSDVVAANAVSYCSSKGAVRSLTKALAIELAPSKIRVNSVHPGMTMTNLISQAMEDVAQKNETNKEEAMKQFAATYPLGRIGQPGNVADGVTFLASDRASFITGAELFIDGGMTVQ